jgi:hypothetical protein
MLLEKLKSIVGEVNASHFKELMLERIPSENACPYFYFDGTSYFTLERPGGPEVRDEKVGPGDVIGVEWKRADETFSDYVRRKTMPVVKTIPARELVKPAPALSEEQKADVAVMDKAMSPVAGSPAAAEPETKDETGS